MDRNEKYPLDYIFTTTSHAIGLIVRLVSMYQVRQSTMSTHCNVNGHLPRLCTRYHWPNELRWESKASTPSWISLQVNITIIIIIIIIIIFNTIGTLIPKG